MEPSEYCKNKLISYKKAVDGLLESFSLNLEDFDAPMDDLIKNGHVQKFEYCTELMWKTVKVWLSSQEVSDLNSPKSVIKAYYRTAAVSDDLYEALLKALHCRSLLSYVYDSDQFEQLYAELPSHIEALVSVVSQLERDLESAS